MRSPDDHVVYEPAVMGLFAVELGSRLTPALRLQLAQVGIDLDHPAPAYPVRVFDDGMELLLGTLFTGLEPADALRRLGYLQVSGFARSKVGWALFKLLRFFSRGRILDRLTRSWRSANNFVEANVTKLSPAHFEVSVNDVGRFPEVTAGVLEAALKEAGEPCRVRVLRTEGISAVYDLRFDEAGSAGFS